jgi:hypothetical protein
MPVAEGLPPEVCEVCGNLEELRPYGPIRDGRRLWICFDCAMTPKRKSETEQAFLATFEDHARD